jgi:glutamate racemase
VTGVSSEATAPIGVFDSGLGGLTVVREMRRRLPADHFIYLGDSAHVPYGSRTQDEIRAFSLGMAHWLLARGCRGLVIACNTATAAAADYLRSLLPVPIVGMEPAVKPAVAVTKSGKVGVLATVGMLSSARYAALLERYGGAVEFLTQPCPGLPEAVERGELETPETRRLIEGYVAPLLAQGADTLVLGCTHYPVLRPLIAEIAGQNVNLIDTGEAVARRVAEVMPSPEEASGQGGITLYTTTGDVEAFARGARAILGAEETAAMPSPMVRRLYWTNGELSDNGTS